MVIYGIWQSLNLSGWTAAQLDHAQNTKEYGKSAKSDQETEKFLCPLAGYLHKFSLLTAYAWLGICITDYIMWS